MRGSGLEASSMESKHKVVGLSWPNSITRMDIHNSEPHDRVPHLRRSSLWLWSAYSPQASLSCQLELHAKQNQYNFEST